MNMSPMALNTMSRNDRQKSAALAAGARIGSSAVKHRACDECRSRKLACSKEPGGCARCNREGIKCVYSAQKQMGRPRKRPLSASVAQEATVGPNVEIVKPDASKEIEATQHAHNHLITEDSVPMLGLEQSGTAALLVDPALDADMSSINILDFLGDDFMSGQPTMDSAEPNQSSSSQTSTWERNVWNFDINFDPPSVTSSEQADNTVAYPSTSSHPNLFSSENIPSSVDYRTDAALPSSTSSTSTTSADDTELRPVACACLANLYLALDSTARLPNEVMPAIRIARSACKVAQDTIFCQKCCPSTLETFIPSAHTTPGPSFQNMVVLCALIPSIAHTYARILSLVDAQAERAAAAGARVPFSLSRCGGLFLRGQGHPTQPSSSPQSHPSSAAASASPPDPSSNSTPGTTPGSCRSNYEDRLLEPAQWRLVVRALLRIDVYGMNCADGNNAAGSCAGGTASGPGVAGPSQPGLRDLVVQIEEKSRARHREVDAMLDAGFVPAHTTAVVRPRHTRSFEDEGRELPCRNMIGVAREAVESLVIA